MSSELIVDELTGRASAGSIAVTAEGGTVTTNLQQGLMKASAKYDQINNAVDDSHNVSGITDTATGRYQVTFSNAMANVNYTAFVCLNDRTSFGDDNFVTDTEATGSFFGRTKHQNASGSAYAQDFVSSSIIHGELA